MEIIYKTGNLLNAQTDVIAHQVNCQGVMGAGVAKQIKEKWPNVYKEYCSYYLNKCDNIPDLLGRCQLVEISDTQYVANLFGQQHYGKSGKRYTSYDAIYNALTSLAMQMLDNGMYSVAIPYKMSCGLAGGDWDIILAMLKSPSIFGVTNITVEIWQLEQF